MGPATPHTVRLILDIIPSLLDAPSASDEHQCTAVVQGGALRHSNLYFCADQLKLSTPVCRNTSTLRTGLVDETYFNKEKHFLYLHWK